MDKLILAIVTAFAGIAFLVFLSFVFSWPVMMLWNGCAVDAIAGLKEITWMQAWGLNILCGILFNKSTK